MMENTPEQPQGRLAHFPISFFAMVMGLSGLTIAWEKAQHVYQLDFGISPLLVGLTVLVFSVFAIIYASKALVCREAVAQELSHPVKLSFFPTISISLLLLAVALLEFMPEVSRGLWVVGAALHLLFTLFVLNAWMHQEHFHIQHINPAWFIPAVGNVLVPVAGMPLGYTDISWFFFSIGMLFWMVLMVIIFYRILFHTPIDARLLPTLFILIAPPAVGFLAYVKLTNGVLDGFGRFLYFAGLFLTLLLFSQLSRFLKLQFALSWWAYSFPTAAITIATFLMYEKSGNSFYLGLASILLAILTGVVGLLLVRTTMAAMRGKICVPGH
ncbi:SLAC1 anion channel family protein [Thiothrix nivea]|uniref:C4-dicarboxylate transporter/malic acid transport protein n=1 Tax=Thiothrix nivea (strain ATCC 35100 / DSM 5205 / JP2) TaxID=870187 RepID=A0A656HCU9_THINJ|nr:SLAC1 anion channel family protein [Thiothrix nivea]EIJ33814.1 C4-dicarboxylate transporter/malic acid transport protein [Thiothrix nivea DSM 5205]